MYTHIYAGPESHTLTHSHTHTRAHTYTCCIPLLLLLLLLLRCLVVGLQVVVGRFFGRPTVVAAVAEQRRRGCGGGEGRGGRCPC